ncbi:MAG TPA: hypothetical protein VK745_20105 [Polyangiaceae bacterium]|jgi:hypothetical protein|nr:hypothetical protein [Polyangiaceae bacterium]
MNRVPPEKMPEPPPAQRTEPRVAVGWGPTWFRRLSVFVAGAFLLELALGSNGWAPIPDADLGPLRLFSEGACLFPDAAEFAIEYRVEGWSCARQRFEALDYRPYFPMHESDKESRFYRVASFYHSNRKVMRVLEAYLLQRHNERVARGEDVQPLGMIGGIRVLSLRIPLPAAGQKIERYHYLPLTAYPDSYRKEWYYTQASRRPELCKKALE